MNRPKSPSVAFLLSFVPGLGHLYLGRPVRAFLYGGAFFGLLLVALVTASRISGRLTLLIGLAALFAAAVNMVDMIISLLRGTAGPSYTDSYRSYQAPYYSGEEAAYGPSHPGPDHSGSAFGPHGGPQGFAAWQRGPGDMPPMGNDRYFTVFLSAVPGLGHFQLGLMQRGLAFLALFFGLAVVIFFMAVLTHREVFFVFLGALPVVWLYSLFDCVQQLNRKERGEPLVDRTVFEDFQSSRESGKKNKMLATGLAIFPGAGHMYLGLQKRGLQLMAAFLFSFYLIDTIRLSFFLFLIPILWFYSFFDALQQVSKLGREELRDVPILDWLVHHQRWVGFALLGLGSYYLFDQALINGLDLVLPRDLRIRVINWYNSYFQVFVVSVLLIGGGLRLIAGSSGKR